MSQPTGKQVVTLVPGDGVWPELMNTVKEVFKQAQVPVVFDEKMIRLVVDCLVSLLALIA